MYIILKLQYKRTPTVAAQQSVLLRDFRDIAEKKLKKERKVPQKNLYTPHP